MAFPTSSVLDNFDRANNPTLGASWSVPVLVGNLSPRIVSNSVGPDTDSGNSYTSAFWNAQNFTDSEAYLTVGTVASARRELYLRLDSENTGSENGLALAESFATANEWGLYQLGAGAYTLLGTVFTQAYASGDAFGVEAAGGATTTVLKAYYKASGGSWVQVGATQNIGVVAATGHIGFALQENAAAPRIDDFGGGAIVGSTVEPSFDFPEVLLDRVHPFRMRPGSRPKHFELQDFETGFTPPAGAVSLPPAIRVLQAVNRASTT